MHTFWDTHVHLFPDKLLQAIWKWFRRAGWNIPFSGQDPDTLYSIWQESGAQRAFLLPYCHKPGMSRDLNRWIRNYCQLHPELVPFATVHPLDEDREEILETALDSWGFAGIKLQLAVLGYPADDPSLFSIYWAAWKRDKPVIAHAGTAPYQPHHAEYRSLGLEKLFPVLDAMPRLRLILPHLGLYQLEQAVSLLESYPRVYLDTSWALGNSNLQLDNSRLKAIFRAYSHRILFGSDFPLMEHHPGDSLRHLEQLDLGSEIRERILWKNAADLLHSLGMLNP